MGVRLRYMLAFSLFAMSCTLHAVAQEQCDTLDGLSLEYCRNRNAEGMIYYNKRHYTKAAEIFAELMEYDYPPAITNYGIACMNGTGVKMNTERAYNCFVKASAMGESTAQLHLATMYVLGIAVEKSDSVAFYWFARSALQGNKKAIDTIGKMYQNGTDIGVVVDSTCELLRGYSLSGDLDALYVYGVYLYLCDSSYKDEKLGSGHYCIYSAATRGHHASRTLLLNEAMRDGNYYNIYRWAKLLHESGDYGATKVLADCYRYGWGVPQSNRTARLLYREAAENGNTEAEKMLK